jgi:hypothetical protein
MRLSTLLAATAATLALATAGAANATQYLLQYSNAFGSGNFGTVDVTGTATDLHFVIDVSPLFIVDTGGHFAVAMNLSGSNFAYVGPVGFTLATGTDLQNSPFGGFNVALNCTTACGNGGGLPHPASPFVFDITGTGLGVLAADDFNGHPINFAVDVVTNGNTGVVGGGLGGGGGVPEPSAWALMILGFGGVGATMRNRRRSLVTA